jgi:hypothetical protein
MSEKQLNCSQIAGLAVDLRRLGAAHRVHAIRAAVHPGTLDPTVHNARVLARRHVRLIVDSAWKYVGGSICGARFQQVFQRGAGLFRDLELDRTAGLVLDDRGPVSLTWGPMAMSSTRRLTRSQPLSLLSIARLNIARSRLWRLI